MSKQDLYDAAAERVAEICDRHWGTRPMKKELFINAITSASGEFNEAFLVSFSENKENKRKQPYVSLKLQDRTGECDAKLWDCADVIPVGSFIKVRVEAGEYREELQLKILKWRLLSDDEVEISDFIRASEHNRQDMLTGLHSNLAYIKNVFMRAITERMIRQYGDLLLDAPAAKTNHQPFLGGLLEHIHNLMALVLGVCAAYRCDPPTGGIVPDSSLDHGLLLSACMLHDIGKIYELSYKRSIAYTRRGSLAGHVVIGLQMFAEARAAVTMVCEDCATPGLDCPCGGRCRPATEDEQRELDHLEHLIVSHHGQKDWGAQIEPMSREAVVFHQIDMIDSRMGFFDELMRLQPHASGKLPLDSSSEFKYHKGSNYFLPPKGGGTTKDKYKDESQTKEFGLD